MKRPCNVAPLVDPDGVPVPIFAGHFFTFVALPIFLLFSFCVLLPSPVIEWKPLVFFCHSKHKKKTSFSHSSHCADVKLMRSKSKKKGTWSSEGRIDYSSWVIYPQVWEPSAQKKEKGWQKKIAKERHGTQTNHDPILCWVIYPHQPSWVIYPPVWETSMYTRKPSNGTAVNKLTTPFLMNIFELLTVIVTFGSSHITKRGTWSVAKQKAQEGQKGKE